MFEWVCLLQVKYKEAFERNRGQSQMEFRDTEAYRVSKEAQKMQSEVKTRRRHTADRRRGGGAVSSSANFFPYISLSDLQKEYRRDYEEHVKGRALVDVEQTPGYLTARHASSLLNEVLHTRRHTQIKLIVNIEVLMCCLVVFILA